MHIDTVGPDELSTAFALTFQHLAHEEREARVARALALVAAGELDAGGILAARTGSQVQGAFVTMLLAGASGLVWPPAVVATPPRSTIEDALVKAGLAALRRRGAKLAQALLASEENHLAAPLQRNGFAHITQLQYLRHSLHDLNAGLDPRHDFVSYAAAPRHLFHETLLRTYEDSRDCPELNDVRTIEEIMQGHQAQGIFDPERWWLVLENDQPIGILLLTQLPEVSAWDLSYVGIVPEKRRRGHGRSLTQKALHEAQRAGAEQLGLAVDVRNVAASQLYLALGFEPSGTREVYLAFFNR